MSARELRLQLDIGPYAGQHPDSVVLELLAETASITDHNELYHTRSGWWEQLIKEHEAGKLPADAVIAAVTHVMERAESEEELRTLERGPENARALKAGTKVVAIRKSFDYGFVWPELSGTLNEDAIAILEPPTGAAGVDLGLRFTGTRDYRQTEPESPFVIGEKAIRDFYDKTIVSEEALARMSAERIGRELLDLLTTMKNLGIESDNPRVDSLEERSISELSQDIETMAPHLKVSDGRGSFTIANGHRLRQNLEYLQVLAPDLAEKRIQDLIAGSIKGYEFWLYEKYLPEAVAAVRSPYQLDGMTETEHKLWLAKAEAEIYQSRFDTLPDDEK